MKQPTMEDVANLAGVSAATVSYVINHGPRPVAEHTQQRVNEAIKVLGYQPHAIAHSLKRGSTQTVGLLVQSLISAFVSNLVNSIEENLAEHNYSLILASAHEDCDRETHMINTLAGQSIDGLLLIPTSCRNGHLIDRLIQRGIPVVLVDRDIQDSYVDIVMTDNVDASKNVTNHLIELGCRRILCISFSDDASSALDRVKGYRLALNQNGIPIDENLIYVFQYASGESIEQSLLDHIHKYGSPDGVLCTTDTMLIDVTETLTKTGIKVPEQVRVGGGFFDSPWNRLLDPPLPIVSQNYKLISKYSVEFLLDRINGNQEPPRVKLIPADLNYTEGIR